MFYKHWKKMALALTAFFWNSCDNAPTSIDSNGANPSSSSGDNGSSSSEVTPSSSSNDFSQVVPLYGIRMSSIVQSSSSNAESSSSFEQIMPAYGVYGQFACYEDGKGVKTNDEVNVTKLICDDGVVCKERESHHYTSECYPIDDDEGVKGGMVCLDYGIIHITERTYDCNGIKFNEAEFRSRYDRKYTTKPKTEE